MMVLVVEGRVLGMSVKGFRIITLRLKTAPKPFKNMVFWAQTPLNHEALEHKGHDLGRL